MNNFSSLLYIFVSSMVVENLLFARALGADGILERSRVYRDILRFGSLTMLVTCVGGALSWAVFTLMEESPLWTQFRGLVAVLGLSVGFLAAWLMVNKGFTIAEGKRHDSLMLTAAAFNVASLGTVLMAVAAKGSFLSTVVRCMGYSSGLILAMGLVHSGRERLAHSGVPRAFKGLPITLIYIGILSLAVYGLIGHQLPT